MLTIVLIPSVALLVTGGTVAGLLVAQGVDALNFSTYLGEEIGPLVDFETVVQQERTISLRAVGGDPDALAGLAAQRNKTNAVLAEIASLTPVVQKLNPQAVSQSNAAFAQLAQALQATRAAIDAHQATPAAVDGFFTKLGGVVIIGLQGVANSTPDARTAAEEITTTDLVWVTDLQSRATGVGAGAAAAGPLSDADRLTVAQLVGGYRNQLNAVASRLTSGETATYTALVNGNAYQVATSGEDSLASTGRLNVPMADWLTAENQVSTQLLSLWGQHFRFAESLAKDAANQTLVQSILAGAGVLVLAVLALLIAIRLANALVRRLRRLRSRTLEVADEQLPGMVRRLHEGEAVDIEAEMELLDPGTDEVGQVAEAFGTAQRTAILATMAEVRARDGINNVFLDIAHRSQVVVHRQLEVLDVAEAKQDDPEHLELLFQLDHLATHARRNAENLLILAGGQPGRKWRQPVSLEDIVRSAVSETEDFTRVSAIRLPDVRVLGGVVADLIHLLAELVENATSFSPPDSVVSVHGNLVGKGVVVEVDDQGLGIEPDEREMFNDRLHNPPDFQEMALAGQRRLGLFVVGQLAKRHGITVTLLDSAYGGIKAIVLIPTDVIDTDPTTPPVGELEQELLRRGGRHHRKPRFVPQPAEDPVPRRPDATANLLEQWPVDEPDDTTMSLPAFRQSVEHFDAPEPPAAPPAAPPVRASRSRRRALPKRKRLANLAPQLQVDPTDPTAETTRTERGSGRLRDPEDARRSMSSFQRGTRQGRGTPGQHNE
ncbi:MAG TPA: nitrate- and nitrite sensing domain-containing protein [Pseudonocardiaceae bacterium]|nr:nitrate- and nitrite sensing domain-containing protein [Pseudonocardiaceae bacterium]